MKNAIIIGNGNSTKQLYEYGFKNIDVGTSSHSEVGITIL